MRCTTALGRRTSGGNGAATAFALAALVLYPVAVALPMIEIEKFGHSSEASILGGIATMFSAGQWFIAGVVLACSVVLPLFKLLAILILTSGWVTLAERHRATTYRLVEWTGRWGMLDVLLVTMLVAALKIGDLVHVAAGPAALAFLMVVLLSLLSAACFDEHSLWESER